VPLVAPTATVPIPAGALSSRRGSPPPTGSSHSDGTSASPSSLTSWSGRFSRSRSEPSGVYAATEVPVAGTVSRRAGPPAASSSQTAARNPFPSGARVVAVTTRRPPGPAIGADRRVMAR